MHMRLFLVLVTLGVCLFTLPEERSSAAPPLHGTMQRETAAASFYGDAASFYRQLPIEIADWREFPSYLAIYVDDVHIEDPELFLGGFSAHFEIYDPVTGDVLLSCDASTLLTPEQFDVADDLSAASVEIVVAWFFGLLGGVSSATICPAVGPARFVMYWAPDSRDLDTFRTKARSEHCRIREVNRSRSATASGSVSDVHGAISVVNGRGYMRVIEQDSLCR